MRVAIGLVAAMLAIGGCGTAPQSPDPAPSKSPKLVVENPTFDFGLMSTLEKREHTFVLRNEGDAPLTLIRTGATCTCLKLHLDEFEIPPGESREATVRWRVIMPYEKFEESLNFKSNDPAQPVFHLSVTGRIERMLGIEPDVWNVGKVREDAPAEFIGTLISDRDDFAISAIECSNPEWTSEVVDFTDDQKKKLKARKGFQVQLRIPPASIPPGPIRQSVTVRTPINGGTAYVVDVMGFRPGPIEISGPGWDGRNYYLDFDQFPAVDGKTLNLMFSVTNAEEEFRFLDVQSDDPRIDVSLTKSDQGEGARQFFRLKVSLKPGLPAAGHRGEYASKVRVKTNHPAAPQFTFFVEYAAL